MFKNIQIFVQNLEIFLGLHDEGLTRSRISHRRSIPLVKTLPTMFLSQVSTWHYCPPESFKSDFIVPTFCECRDHRFTRILVYLWSQVWRFYCTDWFYCTDCTVLYWLLTLCKTTRPLYCTNYHIISTADLFISRAY